MKYGGTMKSGTMLLLRKLWSIGFNDYFTNMYDFT